MSDTRLEREFAVSPARLFEAVSSNAQLLRWWGPDTAEMLEQRLDFSKTGPWHYVMKTAEGKMFKMSGQVTRVDPITTIGFTWGWHDDQDMRGDETHVTFTVVETARGAKLIIDHRDFLTDKAAADHHGGWSTLTGRLAVLLET